MSRRIEIGEQGSASYKPWATTQKQGQNNPPLLRTLCEPLTSASQPVRFLQRNQFSVHTLGTDLSGLVEYWAHCQWVHTSLLCMDQVGSWFS
jgi:hypothetical protein